MEVIEQVAPFCKQVACRLPNCDLELGCRYLCTKLTPRIMEVLIECSGKFYKACGPFVDRIGPICPFDPVQRAREFLLQERIDALDVKVKDLRNQIAKG